MSPDSPEAEPEYNLTPRTEAKYSKIDEEFQMMMQRNQLNGSRVGVGVTGSNYNLPVSVPVGNYDQSLLQASPQMHTSISPRPSSSETDSGELPHSFDWTYWDVLLIFRQPLLGLVLALALLTSMSNTSNSNHSPRASGSSAFFLLL